MMASWSIDPSRFVKGAIENIERVRKKYAFDVFSLVVKATPVDTGQARGAWLPSIGQPEDGVPGTKDKSGRETINKIKSVVESAKGEDTLFLVNSLPYITVLEYGGYPNPPKNGGKTKEYIRKDGTKVGGLPKTVGGYSRQAPSGMIGRVMAQADQIFQAAVNAVKGGGS
ncbi:MAG: hypothetical protein LBQ88_03575 [Treponema sp.]|jgi:hypothetical protein|nr:hypothetical protein [Treponema sp.]